MCADVIIRARNSRRKKEDDLVEGYSKKTTRKDQNNAKEEVTIQVA